jgi:protoporphyrin/coproporphyrin ferrochelatase
MQMKAVVLFNLGGPDSLENVKPFLFNLFNDEAIINLPNPFRYILAKFVSSRRNKKAQAIYAHLGGKSPILEETQAQANALQNLLGEEYKVFIAMRYWTPMAEAIVDEVLSSKPDEIILLPLYPQFSTTTTGSFFTHWDKIMRDRGYRIPLRQICCYPDFPLYIKASQTVIREAIRDKNIPQNARFLFSAHGLPKKCIDSGDPYEQQINLSVTSIMSGLPEIKDHVICYQSKVGPLEWLEPSTESEIRRAALDGVPIAIVPISFVSENSETLYELDFEYKAYAQGMGLSGYYRIPTLRDNGIYISALESLIQTCYQPECARTSCANKNKRQIAV